MALKPTELRRRLREAIGEAKNGNRIRARELLLQLVQLDSESELAWWWLNVAADDRQERLRALENVLRLNPLNAEAHDQLTLLRQQQLATAPRGEAPNWGRLLPETPAESDDGLDDPYQCPYCGWPTGIDDRRCPECGHSLYWRVARSAASSSLRTVTAVLVIGMALSIIQGLGPLFALGVHRGMADRAAFQLMLSIVGVRQFWGNFLALTPAQITLLLPVYAARALIFLLLLLGLRQRWVAAYYATMLALFGDLALNLYLLAGGQLGFIGALLNLGLIMAAIVSLFGANYEFAVNYERMLVKPDGAARSGPDFYQRGHQYRKQGMWALAVAQWRRAVGLSPASTHYYKDLGIGYAQIGRFQRSLRVLEEAQRRAPDDHEVAEVIALVRKKAAADSVLKR